MSSPQDRSVGKRLALAVLRHVLCARRDAKRGHHASDIGVNTRAE